MGGVERRGRGADRDLLGLRRIRLRLGDVAVVGHRVEDLRATRERGGHVLDRVVLGGGLGQAREQGHLSERELAEVSDAEVRRRGGLQSVRLVPVVDLVEVHLEDLLLAEGPCRLDGKDRLLDLAGERRVVAEQPRLDELLGDRRAALRDPAGGIVRLDRTNDPRDVDARVRPEGLVLDRDRRLLHLVGNGAQRDELAALVGERVEKVLAGPVVDMGGERNRNGGQVVRGGKVGGEIADRGGDGDPDEGHSGEKDRGQDPRERADRPHRADAARHAAAAALREAIGAIRPAGRYPLDGHPQLGNQGMHGTCHRRNRGRLTICLTCKRASAVRHPRTAWGLSAARRACCGARASPSHSSITRRSSSLMLFAGPRRSMADSASGILA